MYIFFRMGLRVKVILKFKIGVRIVEWIFIEFVYEFLWNLGGFWN